MSSAAKLRRRLCRHESASVATPRPAYNRHAGEEFLSDKRRQVGTFRVSRGLARISRRFARNPMPSRERLEIYTRLCIRALSPSLSLSLSSRSVFFRVFFRPSGAKQTRQNSGLSARDVRESVARRNGCSVGRRNACRDGCKNVGFQIESVSRLLRFVRTLAVAIEIQTRGFTYIRYGACNNAR